MEQFHEFQQSYWGIFTLNVCVASASVTAVSNIDRELISFYVTDIEDVQCVQTLSLQDGVLYFSTVHRPSVPGPPFCPLPVPVHRAASRNTGATPAPPWPTPPTPPESSTPECHLPPPQTTTTKLNVSPTCDLDLDLHSVLETRTNNQRNKIFLFLKTQLNSTSKLFLWMVSELSVR